MRSLRASAWALLACLLLAARPGAALAAGDSTAAAVSAAPGAAGASVRDTLRPPATIASPTFPDTLLRLLAASDHAGPLGLLRADRLQHGSLSFTLAASAGLGGRSRAEAFGFAFALGLAKELHDGRHGRFDPVDLTADFAGAALGVWAAARR